MEKAKVFTHGYIYTPRSARKTYSCKVCQLPIAACESYYGVTIAGGGLGNIKFPDRIHTACLGRHQAMIEERGLING